MSDYMEQTWTNGVSVANAARMTHIEDGITAIPGFYIISPYLLVNNININSGVTNNYTCTGVGGITSGAKAVLLAYYYSSAATNTFVAFTPHGTAYSNGNYPASNPVATGSGIGNAGSFIVPLDGSGKIDVAVSNGNITGLYINLIGYIH